MVDRKLKKKVGNGQKTQLGLKNTHAQEYQEVTKEEMGEGKAKGRIEEEGRRRCQR